MTSGRVREAVDLGTLDEIQQQVLWLSTRIVDHANRERPNPSGIKVGGHQASSASMVGLMTVLWFSFLEAGDLVSVKPHASPVLHAVEYLLGRLDRSYLTRLRELGGLQAYPSRTKDPFPVDFSTGSVGLGAVAPVYAGVARRYLAAHFDGVPHPRLVALMGDAELDEGNVWETLLEPACEGVERVMWVVDLNRQSLDRVVPGVKAARLGRMFEAAGWTVLQAKYGRLLTEAFERRGGEALRRHLDDMPNEQYQSLFPLRADALRERFLLDADRAVARFVGEVPDDDLYRLVTDLGGHDLATLQSTFEAADAAGGGPSVVFAYTVKGWGTPLAGDPMNHAALLTGEQVAALRERVGRTPETEWDRLDPATPAGAWCEERARHLAAPVSSMSSDGHAAPTLSVPAEVGVPTAKPLSTQEAFGRVLAGLANHGDVRERLVTVSPDVSVSTNLGGWINKVGVFAPTASSLPPDSRRLLRWEPGPAGRHIELGISEMNLFMLLEELGLTAERFGRVLLPVGTVYDPFVCRGLDALIHAVYSGSKFVFAGTPSGITLSYEGGAHQSVITASIGMELPGLRLAEPAFARAVDWLLCDGLARLCDRDDGESLYLRLSTRPVDQAPFARALERLGEDAMRRGVLEGGYHLVDARADLGADGPAVNLFTCGAVVPEVVAAAEVLADEGVAADVFDLTSADALFRAWRGAGRLAVRTSTEVQPAGIAGIVPARDRRAPAVTVHDASPHALAWVGAALGVPVLPLGVDRFGQAGSVDALYREYDLDTDAVVNAALCALALEPGRTAS